MNMENKIESLLRIGNEIISKVNLNVVNSFIRVKEDSECEKGYDPIIGWMIHFNLEKNIDVECILNNLCVSCEIMGIQYELISYDGKNNTKLNIWITNNSVEGNRLARKVINWNNSGITITNSPYFV